MAQAIFLIAKQLPTVHTQQGAKRPVNYLNIKYLDA